MWRNTIIPLLKAYNLLGHADGSLPASTERISVTEGGQTKEIPNPEFKQWTMQDQLALTYILAGVEVDAGVQLMGVASAS